VIIFIDRDEEVGDSWSGCHSHGYSASLAKDKIAKSHAIVLHNNVQCLFYSLAVIFVPNCR
jgi:hypothetical protein